MRLLDRLADLLQIELLVEALHRRDALAPVALLYADVDEVLLLAVGFGIGKGVGTAPYRGARVRERVCGSRTKGRAQAGPRLKVRPWRAAPTGAAPSEAKSMHGSVRKVGLRRG